MASEESRNDPPVAKRARAWLCDTTAAALVDVFLEHDRERRGAIVSSLVQDDPAFAAWALAAAMGDEHAEIGSCAALCDWLAGGHAWIAALASALDSHDESTAGDRRALARRVSDAVGLAGAARHIAGDQRGRAGVAERAALLAIASTFPDFATAYHAADSHWLASDLRGLLVSTAEPAPDSPPSPALLAVRKAMAALSAPDARVRGLDRAKLRQQADTARRRWLARKNGAKARLAHLATRLARLETLEGQFAATLRKDKLASLAEFAAGAGHEMNNPLAVISGRAQLCLRGETHPEKRRELATILAQAMRVHDMIADLMLFARPPRPELAELDLTALVASLVDAFRAKASERRISVMVVDPGQPLTIKADHTQLAVALRALLDNAYNASQDDGRIVVEIEAAARGEVAIHVQDEGHGMTEEVRRHLFDPYYSGRLAGRGLGLGLSKAWRIATMHGGTVEVAARPGRGSVCSIRLPALGSRLAIDHNRDRV